MKWCEINDTNEEFLPHIIKYCCRKFISREIDITYVPMNWGCRLYFTSRVNKCHFSSPDNFYVNWTVLISQYQFASFFLFDCASPYRYNLLIFNTSFSLDFSISNININTFYAKFMNWYTQINTFQLVSNSKWSSKRTLYLDKDKCGKNLPLIAKYQ